MMINRVLKLLSPYKNLRVLVRNISWRLSSTTCEREIIFIVGAPRSGTTLLQRILSVHEGLFSIEGETGLFSYQNIFDLSRKHFGLPDSQVNEMFDSAHDVVDFFNRGVGLLSKQNDGATFVEKTPQHILYLPFILSRFPNAKIVHIVRDGRDCFCSSKSNKWVPQNASSQRFSRYWKKCVRRAMKYENESRIYTIKYESLVTEPQLSVEGLMKFVGLEYQKSQLNSLKIGSDSRAALPEFSRLSEKINGSSMGRWASEMTQKDINDFEAISNEELVFYGYKISEKR